MPVAILSRVLELLLKRGSCGARLTPSLLALGTALADFELRVALANHVNSTTSLDDLAIGVPVFQGTNAADNFHGITLNGFGSTNLLHTPASSGVLFLMENRGV